MTTKPDLTLPPTCPEAIPYRTISDVHPVALYTLADLSDDELQELQKVSESNCQLPDDKKGTNVKIAPRPRFVGQPLRAVYDAHLELGKDSDAKFDRVLFIVAHEKDWRAAGVLLVTLDDADDPDEPECRPDLCRVPAEEAGMAAVNVQICNISWEDTKEGSLPLDGAGG